MAALTKLLKEHRAALSVEFKSAVTSLEVKTGHCSDVDAGKLSNKMVAKASYAAMEDSFNNPQAKTIDLKSN